MISSSPEIASLRAQLSSPPSGSPEPRLVTALDSPSTSEGSPPPPPRRRPRRRPTRAVSVAMSSPTAASALAGQSSDDIGSSGGRDGSDGQSGPDSPALGILTMPRATSDSTLDVASSGVASPRRELPTPPPAVASSKAAQASINEANESAERVRERAPSPRVKQPTVLTLAALEAELATLPPGSHGSSVFDPEYGSNATVVVAEPPAEPVIKAATAYTLVREMTSSDAEARGIEYRELFLVYRSFVTPRAMARLLALRVEDPRLPQFSPVVTRTAHVLRYWINLEFERVFAQNEPLLAAVRDIGARILPGQGVVTLGEQIVGLVEKKETELANKLHIEEMSSAERDAAELAGDDVVVQHMFKVMQEKVRLRNSAPEPLIDASNLSDNFHLTFIPAMELARQLTLLEHRLLAAIDVRAECLGQMWTKKKDASVAPNVKRLINQFNIISQFVASTIMARDSIEDRASELAHFIDVAAACRQLNNFNGVMEILAGLQFSEVYRLQMTWDRVAERKLATFAELKELMSRDKNMKAPRMALATCTPPAVPYLGMFLTDLTFIEDGNADTVGDAALVNYEKRRMLASVVADIIKYQKSPYTLITIPAIQDWLTREPKVAYDENALYQRSLELEPRTVLKDYRARKDSEALAASKNSGVMRFVDRLKKSRAQAKADEAESEANDDDAENNGDDDDLMYFVATSTRARSGSAKDKEPSRTSRASSCSGVGLDNVVAYIVGRPPTAENFVVDVSMPLRDGGPRIVAASLHQLLRELTSFAKARPDAEVLDAFLATYKQFTTPVEIIRILEELFNWPVPEALAEDESLAEVWRAKVLRPTRQRIFIFVNSWKKERFEDFIPDDGSEAALEAFTDNHIAPVFSAGAEQLKRVRKKRAKTRRRRAASTVSSGDVLLAGDVNWARSNGEVVLAAQPDVKLRMSMIQPMELARQLTIAASAHLDAISADELSSLGIAGSRLATHNISAALQSFSRVTNMVATEVVRGLTLQARVATLEYMISVAVALWELHNYDSLVAVMRGLMCPSVTPQLWANLPVGASEAAEKLKAFAGGADKYAAVVAEVEATSPPGVPYMGAIFLAIKSQQAVASVTPTGLIAFGKYLAIHSALVVFDRFRDSVWRFVSVPFIQRYILDYKSYPRERRLEVVQLRAKKAAAAASAASASS
ncbi:cell division control protein [Thecamonas trahens ATCC 50062]|uniref:Cell division control protein n=1 Tax=Thecamonas trahens ATCC 50062 TaxID=461836 RepID=A0A0L0D2L4_THETB|nr:cell division control protein [Thecamonas trahens ATCC 50062]KNC46431.1 cell division control protein [Thecamonas trahens ATCC 50062]|eukprot:XP_013760722.1 cell division control protein [Thecamonas trahens ATCC 50062]